MENQKLPVTLRRAEEKDISFIFNSWLKSYRTSYFAKSIGNTIYFSEHHKVIEKLAKTSEVLVACNSEDPDQIYGYMCAEKIDGIFCLHYVYIKQPFRRLGVGKLLLSSFDRDSEQASVYTHHTKLAEKLAAKYNMIYHPYLLINVEADNVNS